jgi:hypothetical protein
MFSDVSKYKAKLSFKLIKKRKEDTRLLEDQLTCHTHKARKKETPLKNEKPSSICASRTF